MATWLEDTITALTNLGGVATYARLYEEIRRLRTEPLPPTWEAIVRRTVETHSSDSEAYGGKRDLFYSVEGLGKGVWGLRSMTPDTPSASDVGEPGIPGRALMKTYRVLRDTALARSLKLLHENRCQVCGEVIDLGDGRTYSEAHHIRPLGDPHRGPDVAENILVLCPNHHVLCDYGALVLDVEKLRTNAAHSLGADYIQYHNEVIAVRFR